jgi:hypothetical protein
METTFTTPSFIRRRRMAQRLIALAAPLLLMAACEQPRVPEPVVNEQTYQAYRAKLMKGSGGPAAAEGGEAVASGTGWGNLSGVFKFADGATIPSRKPLEVNKDQDVCKPGGAPVLSQSLLIDDSTRGIANVLIFVRKVSREHESVQSTDSVLFDQAKCVFLSHVQPVRIGQTVEIKNSDPVAHNTNISRAGMKGASFNQTVPSGASIPFQPTAEEISPVDVSCSIHPWMKAFVMPRANGYFAVTKPDGTFAIENLPAGEPLEFQVWHEIGAGSGGALVGETTDVTGWGKNGRFKLTLEADASKTLNVSVPASSFN